MNKEVVKAQAFQGQDEEGEIELDIGGNTFNFQWAELAPPSGVMEQIIQGSFLYHFEFFTDPIT